MANVDPEVEAQVAAERLKRQAKMNAEDAELNIVHWVRVFGTVEFVTKLLVFAVILLIVLVIGLAIQVQNRNQQIDDLGVAVDKLEESANRTERVSQMTGDQISAAIEEVRNPSPQTLRTREQVENLERMLSQLTGIPPTPPLPTTSTTAASQ